MEKSLILCKQHNASTKIHYFTMKTSFWLFFTEKNWKESPDCLWNSAEVGAIIRVALILLNKARLCTAKSMYFSFMLNPLSCNKGTKIHVGQVEGKSIVKKWVCLHECKNTKQGLISLKPLLEMNERWKCYMGERLWLGILSKCHWKEVAMPRLQSRNYPLSYCIKWTCVSFVKNFQFYERRELLVFLSEIVL